MDRIALFYSRILNPGCAAIATNPSFILMLTLRFHYIRRIMEFPVPIVAILKTFAGGGVSLMTIWALKSAISLNPWLELFIVMIPALVIYALWICKIGIL